VTPKKNTSAAPPPRKSSNRLSIAEPSPSPASDDDSIAELLSESIESRLDRIGVALRSRGRVTEARVLERVRAALSGDTEAAAVVSSIAKLTRPKRGRGRRPNVATSMFPKLVQRVAHVRSKGQDDVVIAKGVIRLFVTFLGQSRAADALSADEAKLAEIARANLDDEKFVRALYRALSYTGRPDNVKNRESKARSRKHAARRSKRALH
jgi:hypothetical protein